MYQTRRYSFGVYFRKTSVLDQSEVLYMGYFIREEYGTCGPNFGKYKKNFFHDSTFGL